MHEFVWIVRLVYQLHFWKCQMMFESIHSTHTHTLFLLNVFLVEACVWRVMLLAVLVALFSFSSIFKSIIRLAYASKVSKNRLKWAALIWQLDISFTWHWFDFIFHLLFNRVFRSFYSHSTYFFFSLKCNVYLTVVWFANNNNSLKFNGGLIDYN